MLSLESILALLDELRNEAIGLVETPKDRDAFAFGAAHGALEVIHNLRNRVEELVNQNNQGDDVG